jgi:hypothetical protein
MENERGQELRLLRGGQYGRSGARLAIEGERLMRERFYALQRNGGKPLSDEVVHNIAEGRTYPTRRIRKLLARLKAKQVAREAAWSAVMEPMQREFNSVYGQAGEHTTPAA